MNKVMTTHNPLVSIIVPFYNHEDYIRETLESVISQDYRPIQIICSDDASPDKSAEVLKSCAELNPHEIEAYFHESNLGITKNFNFLLNKAKGDYVAFLGGDDVMKPGRIQKQVEHFLKDSQLTLSYSNAEVFESESGEILSLHNHEKSNPPVEGPGEKLILGNVICGSAAMVKRSAIPQEGFDERIPVVCDWLFFIRIGLAGKIGFISEPLVRYRRHQGNVSLVSKTQWDQEKQSLEILAKDFPLLEPNISLGFAYLEARIAESLAKDKKYSKASATMRRAVRLGLPKTTFSILFSIHPLCVDLIRWLKQILTRKKAHWSQKS